MGASQWGGMGQAEGPGWRKRCGSRWFYLAGKHSNEKVLGRMGRPSEEPASGILGPPLVGNKELLIFL